MVCSEFEVLMRQYMNYSDRFTVKAIAEASMDNQSQILTALTSRLYNLIVDKADKIDYSTIAKSKGDITKVQNYDQLVECIDIIRKIVVEYKEPTASVDTVITAMENIKKRTAQFKKAFSINAPIPKMMYNNIVLAIVNSVSFMIATCIEYVKSPDASSFDIALDAVAYRQTMNHLMFATLADFNKGCMDVDFDTALKLCLDKRVVKEAMLAKMESEDEMDKPFLTPEEIENGKEVIIHDFKEKSINEGFGTGVVNVVRGLTFILKCFIPIIRTIVYYIYSTKQNIYDYFTVQAQMLEMNAYNLQQSNDIDEERKKKAYDKQMKIAAKFRTIANKFAIEDSVATKKAKEMESKEDEKYDADDLAGDVAEGDEDIF